MTNYTNEQRPDIPEGINGVTNVLGAPGDWDNGPHFVLDGALINKADEGARRHEHGRDGGDIFAEGSTPYIGWFHNPQDAGPQQDTFFSPNRQVSSPVMFGSLSTGVKRGHPWQTLLFRPAIDGLPGGKNHPGSAQAGPPDHLLLDLFWMPIVEPYAISEPFATAGKINMNYQVAPFTYIKRDTGMRAVLQSAKLTALNPTQNNYIANYKLTGSLGQEYGSGGGVGVVLRRNIDLDKTLRQFDWRFAENKPFISASEICDIPLIPAELRQHFNVSFPANASRASDYAAPLKAFWERHKLTGDNSLERPYTHIYPRLTTRSNTYTVHVRVQSLRKSPGGPADVKLFREDRDAVSGDFRGSFVVERYLDPNLQKFENDDDTLGPYRFRVVSSKQFAP
jgi:uncharacterized protein (TIGR02600 family)